MRQLPIQHHKNDQNFHPILLLPCGLRPGLILPSYDNLFDVL